MASSIANLAVILSANAGQFTAGMKRAGASTQRFSATANANIVSVQGAMGALGAAAKRLGPLLAASLGGVAVFRQLERLDEIGKTAERLGLTTQALSRLQFAGEQTGVEVNTLNMALQRMTRRVAEAAAGTGEAKDAIKELGLDAAALNAMGPAKAFAEISKAMEGVTGSGDKVRLAMKLFDSEGVRLVNTLNLGAKGLAEMSAKSDELGNTIDGKTAKAAAEFNDAINELKTALGGTVKELVTALLPALKGLVGVLTAAATGVNTLVGAFKSLFNGEWMGEWTAPGELRKVSEEAKRAKEEAMVLREEMQRLTDVAGEQALAGIFDKFKGQAITTFEPVVDTIVSSFHKIEAAMEQARGRAAGIFESTRTPAEKMKARLKEIRELTEQGFLTPDTAMRALAQLREAAKPLSVDIAPPELTAQRVSFAAIGAEGAAGRGQDKIEKNTAEEVKESKKQTKALADILRIGVNSQGAAVTVNF